VHLLAFDSIVSMCVNALRTKFSWRDVKSAMSGVNSDACVIEITRRFHTGSNEIIH
jgi:hypothetical protein